MEDHGWDAARNAPCDQRLRIDRVVQINLNARNVMPVETAAISYLKETISKNEKILASTSSQQMRTLQQEINLLKSQLSSKTQMIRQLDAQKVRLEVEVASLRNALQSQMINNNHHQFRRQSHSKRGIMFKLSLVSVPLILIAIFYTRNSSFPSLNLNKFAEVLNTPQLALQVKLADFKNSISSVFASRFNLDFVERFWNPLKNGLNI